MGMVYAIQTNDNSLLYVFKENMKKRLLCYMIFMINGRRNDTTRYPVSFEKVRMLEDIHENYSTHNLFFIILFYSCSSSTKNICSLHYPHLWGRGNFNEGMKNLK